MGFARSTKYLVSSVRQGHTDPTQVRAKDEPIAEPIQPDSQPDEPQAARQPAKHLRERAKLASKELRVEGRARVRAAKAQARSDAAAIKVARQSRARAAKQAKRDAKAAERAARHDHIVEAPREPRKSLAQKLRRATPKVWSDSTSAGRRIAALLGVLVGMTGLVCSIILAIGALLVAQGADETGSFYESVSSICDVLVGPLRDHISFSGSNAEMKEALVAWGGGSLIYLLIGLMAQSVLGADTED